MRWLSLVLWSAVILLSANDTMSAETTGGWLTTLFAHLSPEVLALLNFLLRKLTHIVAYGIEGALAYHATRNWRWAVGIAVTIAIADESMQAATALRGGNVWDVLLDSVAAIVVVSFRRRTR